MDTWRALFGCGAGWATDFTVGASWDQCYDFEKGILCFYLKYKVFMEKMTTDKCFKRYHPKPWRHSIARPIVSVTSAAGEDDTTRPRRHLKSYHPIPLRDSIARPITPVSLVAGGEASELL
jgi:hypothetical protein